MTIFAVIAPAESASLKAAVASTFEKYFEFGPGQFVVAESGMTAAQLARKLGANGEVGRFVVFTTSNHWGFHRKDLWEWLSANAS